MFYELAALEPTGAILRRIIDLFKEKKDDTDIYPRISELKTIELN